MLKPKLTATLITPGCYFIPSDGDTPFLISACAEVDSPMQIQDAAVIAIRCSRAEVLRLVQDLQELLEASK